MPKGFEVSGPEQPGVSRGRLWSKVYGSGGRREVRTEGGLRPKIGLAALSRRHRPEAARDRGQGSTSVLLREGAKRQGGAEPGVGWAHKHQSPRDPKTQTAKEAVNLKKVVSDLQKNMTLAQHEHYISCLCVLLTSF